MRPRWPSWACARASIEPVWDGKAFQPRLMLPLSLTWDHRVIDGAAAARFNAYLGQILADFRRVLLVTTRVVVRKARPGGDRRRHAGHLRRHAPGAPLRGQQQAVQGGHAGRAELGRHGRHRGALPGAAQGDERAAAASSCCCTARTRCSTPSPSCIRMLKETFFLQTKEDDNDPYESSQFSVVIANAARHLRRSTATARCSSSSAFWGIGSGRALCARRDVRRLGQGQNRPRSGAGRHPRRLRIRHATPPRRCDLYTLKLKT